MLAKPTGKHINQVIGCCQHPEPPATLKEAAALISCTGEGAVGVWVAESSPGS